VLPAPVQHALHEAIPSIPAHRGARQQARRPRRTAHRSETTRCVTCEARHHHPSTSDRTRPRRHPRCTPVSHWAHPQPRWTPTMRPASTRSHGWWSAWDPAWCGARWHGQWWHLRHRMILPHSSRRFNRPWRHHGGMPIPHPSHLPAPRLSRHATPRPSGPWARRGGGVSRT
jgi:hypothetical protein